MTDVQVVFLNGPSSSGKSSLAHGLQQRLAIPFIFFPEDMFFSGLPGREYTEAEGHLYGSRLYSGFTRCVRTMVESGNRVIVDTVAWNPGSLTGFVDALWDLSVFAVGIRCDLAILEERERLRGDRSTGLARRQYGKVHQDALYDIEIDTSVADIDVCARLVADAMLAPTTPHAFARMKQRLDDGNSG
jgi:chloramphenicol 3-O phosphotransferase